MAAGGAVILLLMLALLLSDGGRRGRPFPRAAESLLAPFAAGAPSDNAYDDLFRYFLTGFVTYQDSLGGSAWYPGLPSKHGARIDAMEGFTRFAPLAAAWLHSGRPSRVELRDGGTVDLVALIRRGLLAGTDPGSPGFWGEIEDNDQRIVESADLALTLWLTRDVIWSRLDPGQKAQIHRWLSGGIAREVPDNNWHLFGTFVPLVLRSLCEPADLGPAREHYSRLKTFYRGEGWFSDGPGKVYDYYNAWGIHYQLYWIGQVDPTWDPEFIASARQEFLGSYKYLLSRGGVPILGRSVCYRLASPAPLVFDYASASASTAAGEARRALDLVWTYFIRRGALRNGNVTQGYCGPDARVLDNYSGPASCLWSLRSLIPAFAIPPEDRFWRGIPDSLPIERRTYRLRVSSIGWTIVGDAQTGITALTADDSLPDAETHLRSQRLWSKVKALGRRVPNRPPNWRAKYERGTYHSEPPFCECSSSAEDLRQ